MVDEKIKHFFLDLFSENVGIFGRFLHLFWFWALVSNWNPKSLLFVIFFFYYFAFLLISIMF